MLVNKSLYKCLDALLIFYSCLGTLLRAARELLISCFINGFSGEVGPTFTGESQKNSIKLISIKEFHDPSNLNLQLFQSSNIV